jgi:subtilase family serine protease
MPYVRRILHPSCTFLEVSQPKTTVHIPEQVWNDDLSSSGLSSGGSGVSTLTARPSWQTGVTGIPSGSFRLVPDISLDASPNNAGYLICSSDSTATGITGSCSNGFRDSSDVYLTVAGGTSFDAPIFSSMLAIVNQKLNSRVNFCQEMLGTAVRHCKPATPRANRWMMSAAS